MEREIRVHKQNYTKWRYTKPIQKVINKELTNSKYTGKREVYIVTYTLKDYD